jgi:hypothetical protein
MATIFIANMFKKKFFKNFNQINQNISSAGTRFFLPFKNHEFCTVNTSIFIFETIKLEKK